MRKNLQKLLFNLILLAALGAGSTVFAQQTWTYDFGTGTAALSGTNADASSSFPTPATNGGSVKARIGTGTGSNAGSFTLANPGLAIGTATEFQFKTNGGSASPTKWGINSFTGSKQGYLKFKITLNGGSVGTYGLAVGPSSNNYTGNSNIASADYFAGVQWSFGTSNSVTYNVYSGTSFGTTGISNPTTLFAQSASNVYDVEIYYNNNSTGSLDYTRAGTTYTISSAKWDLWVNGTKVGSGLAKGGASGNTNIDSFQFYHQTSVTAGSQGTIYLDDIEYSNALALPTIGNVTPNNLDYGNIAVGNTDVKQFTVAQGTAITGNITAATAAPFQVSVDNITFTNSLTFTNPASGSPKTIYVKYSPTAAGPHTGSVTLNTTGATEKTVAVGGTGISSIGNLSTTTLDYGNIAVGGTDIKTFTVSQGTGITSTITAATVAPFQVSLDGTNFSASVSFANPASDTPRSLYVKYSPTASGTHTEAVTLSTTTGATPKTVAVGGNGITTIGDLSTNMLDYGNVNIDSYSTQSFTVGQGTGIAGNITATTTAPIQVSLDGTSFSNSVSFANPGSGATVTIYVRYSPTTAGSHSEAVTLTSTGAAPKTVVAGGTGIASAVIGNVSTDMLDYGNVGVGSTSTQSFTVGHGTAISGNINVDTTAPFQVSLDNITFTNSVSFANPGTGLTTTVYVKYSPANPGPHVQSVIVSATGATEKTVTVGGVGVTAIGTLSTNMLDYGNKELGSSTIQSFTVDSGIGLSANIIAATTAPFQVSLDNTTFSNSVSFANPGSTATTIYVKYSPTTTGSHTETVTLNSTGAAQKSVTVGGTGIILPVITSATTASSTYNTAHTYTITSIGSTPVTYTASNVPSGATFNASAGTITFPQAFPASETPYSISITATNSYGSDTKTLVYTRNKATQTIGTFAATDTKVYGTASYALSVTATSGLAVTYTSSNQGVATINGATVTIVGAGTTTITASQAGDTNWNAATNNPAQTLTVTARPLTITGAAASNKVYDGNNTATISGTYVLNNVVNNEVTLSGNPTGTFASTGVGTGIAVSINGFSITPASSNYTLTQPSSTANITARPVTVTATVQDKTYDGTTAATINAGYTVNNTVNNDVLTVTGVFVNANAGTNKTVNLTLGGSGVANYSLSAQQPAVTATINKAAHPGFTVSSITTGLTTFTIGTSNVTSLSDGAYSYTSSNNSIFTVSGNVITGQAAGTATLNISQDPGTNYLASTPATPNNTLQVTVASVVYPSGAYLSKTGSTNYQAAASWCKCETNACSGTTPGAGGWNTSATTIPGATDTAYIQSALATNSSTSNSISNVVILSGGSLTTNYEYLVGGSILIKDGGKLTINGTAASNFKINANSATFTVEDNAQVIVNNTYSDIDNGLWRGIESFAGNSTFTFNAFYVSISLFGTSAITNNTTTQAKFGNLVFAPTTYAGGNGNMTYLLPSGTYKITHGDFTVSNTSTTRNITLNGDNVTVGRDFIVNTTSTGSTGTVVIHNQLGTKSFTVNRNVIKNGVGIFRGINAVNSSFTFNIDGDLILNAGTFTSHFTNNGSTTSNLNLKGDLTIASGVFFSNQVVTNNAFNFIGTGNGLTDATTQTINIDGNVSTNINFAVKNGAYVKLANDYESGTNSIFTVENGGTFNTDVYKLSGVTTFSSATGSTIATANTAGIGGSVTTTGTKTFNDATNYIFNGVTTAPFPATITKAGNVTTNANVTLNGTVTPSGNVTVNAGTLDLGAFNLNRASTNGGIFTVVTGAKVKVNGGSALFPSGYTTKTLQPNSTVEYAYSGTPAISVGNINGGDYSNVELSGTGAKTLTNGLVVGRDLTIKSENPTITLGAGTTITVKNKVDNQGAATKFVVDNNAALLQENAANVTNANVTEITVIRRSNPLKRLDYTLWGSPVTGQQLLDFSEFTSTNPSRFYTYGLFNNNTQEGYVTADYNANFTPGTGYLIRTPNSLPDLDGYNQGNTAYTHIGEFTGTPNNGNVNVEVGALAGHYIAVSNPYPSPISVKQFLLQNSNVLASDASIFFWRKRNSGSTSTYAQLSLTGYNKNDGNPEGDIAGGGLTYYTGNNDNWMIAPGQGFLVKVKTASELAAAGDTSVSFNNTMRLAATLTNGNQPFFRTLNTNDTNDNPEQSRWWLNLTGTGDAFSQALVGYLPEATLDVDYGYDGKLLNDGTVKLYSKQAENKFGIQARPSFADTDVVAMGFTVSTPGQYTFSLDSMDGVFAQGQDIFIKDNLLGTISNLKQADYTFVSDAGTFESRFEVVYQPQGELGTNNPSLQNSVVVYQNNGTININTGTVEMKGIAIYDVRGSRLYEQANVNSTEAAISNLGVAQQVLIIEIDTVNGKVSKKILY